MPTYLTFVGAVQHEPAIDRWFAERPQPLAALAREWFEAMRQCGPDVRELLHDGCPTACIGDAAFAYVHVFKAHVNVGFFQGASLPDPGSLLEGTGKFMRHVKLRPSERVDSSSLTELIRAAYRDMSARVRAELKPASGESLTRPLGDH